MDGIAREFTEALDRNITYRDIPPEDFERRVRRPGVSDHLFKHLVTIGELHRAGRYDRMTDQVARVTGRQPISVREYVSLHGNEFTQR